MTDTVATFTSQAQAFVSRHPDLNETQRSLGGTTWGMMRAVLECPDHPGSFRTPLDKQWQRLICPVDHTLWEIPS